MDPLHILLVEDDPDDIDLLQAAMKKAQVPFQMATIMQGDSVFPYLSTLTRLPDVIVLDLNLPRMHGKEVLQLLKTSTSFQHIPVAILTTSSSATDRDFCQKAGAEVFLTKPTTVEGFQAITSAILQAAAVS